jgi:hypothetical protein
MPMLIGTGPNQVPTNSMLGDLAYQTKKAPNFDAMPMVGGSPIVESGSNANGHFVRFASGLQICRFSDTTARTTSTTSGNMFVSTAASFTFPAAFVGDLTSLQVTFQPRESSGSICWAGGTWSLTGVSAVQLISASSAANARITYIAVGRWKE